jgi:hypothetical protein
MRQKSSRFCHLDAANAAAAIPAEELNASNDE